MSKIDLPHEDEALASAKAHIEAFTGSDHIGVSRRLSRLQTLLIAALEALPTASRAAILSSPEGEEVIREGAEALDRSLWSIDTPPSGYSLVHPSSEYPQTGDLAWHPKANAWEMLSADECRDSLDSFHAVARRIPADGDSAHSVS